VALHNLTIVAVYGHHDGAAAIPALAHSLGELPGSVGLLLSPAKPDGLPSGVAWRPIQPMDYRQFSLFMMYCLHYFVDTQFALVVQDDGWVVDGRNWRDEYFDYDYIGAPIHAAIVGDRIFQRYSWVGRKNALVIQNGGFSLRSKRFMLAPTAHGVMYRFSDTMPIPNEDVQLTGLLRPKLEGLGIRFAPDDVARQFSVEYLGPGFHDSVRLDKLLGIHGQTRKLVGPKRVRCSLPRDHVGRIFREEELLDHLRRLGYSVEYAETPGSTGVTSSQAGAGSRFC
jgi:hypothetical protein